MNSSNYLNAVPPPASGAADLRPTIDLFRSHLWLLIACAVVCIGLAVTYVLVAPNVYAARSVVLVSQINSKVVNIQDVTPEDLEALDVMKTIEQSLTTDKILLEIVKEQHLDTVPEFLPSPLSATITHWMGGDTTPTDDRLIKALTKHLKVKIRRGTRLIDVIAESEDPVLAQKLSRAVVEHYMQGTAEHREGASQSANGFLIQEAERMKANLEKSAGALQKYREEHNTVSLDNSQNIVVDALKNMNAKLTDARANRLKLEADLAQYRALSTRDPAQLLAITSIANSLGVLDAKRRVEDLEGELARLSGRYRLEHPKYLQAQSQLAIAKSEYHQTILKAGEEISSAYQSAVDEEQKLVAALHDQEDASSSLNKIAIPYATLQRNMEADQALYQTVLTRLRETDLTKALALAPLTVIEEPRVTTKPVKPKSLLIIALGVFCGVGGGIGLVLGLNALDSSIRTIDEAERALDLPVIAAVPLARRKRKTEWKELPVLNAPDSTSAEAFRMLRTHLELKEDTDRQWLLFTSANPDEGKTFCSANCAVALAQQGYRTLLVDGDLRRPSLAPLFRCSTDLPGLSDCLRGATTLRQAVQDGPVENLSILTAGNPVRNAAQVMSQENLARLLRDPAFAAFDRIVFDSAPVNGVCETLHLVRYATSVCLVVRSGKTPLKVCRRAAAALIRAHAKDTGLVLNRLPRSPYYTYLMDYKGYGEGTQVSLTA
jgi:capsular exopolysaccharide synthesis family protein